MRLSYGLCTDAGRVRSGNEDNFYLDGKLRKNTEISSMALKGTAGERPFLAAVCDGMGGEQRGEEASLLAAASLFPVPLEELPAAAVRGVQLANGRICERIRAVGGVRMGSTLSALYIDRGQALVCHVGDSRIYLYRRGSLSRLTDDQTRAASLVRMGLLSQEEAENHPGRHELSQYLGIFEEEMVLEPQLAGPFPLEPGDWLLLCSDGLSDMVTDQGIEKCLGGFGTAGQKAKRLVRLALKGGGRDNVTALVIRAGA